MTTLPSPRLSNSNENKLQSTSLELQLDEISLDHVIGDGPLGTIYSGTVRQNKVSIKVLNPRIFSEPGAIEYFKRESEALSFIHHPNLTLFLGYTLDPLHTMIVHEYLSTDLESFLNGADAKKMPLVERIKMAKELALGMYWLHRNKIAHRELKPTNILIDANQRVKVADYGFSRTRYLASIMLGSPLTLVEKLPYWTSPERLYLMIDKIIHPTQIESVISSAQTPASGDTTHTNLEATSSLTQPRDIQSNTSTELTSSQTLLNTPHNASQTSQTSATVPVRISYEKSDIYSFGIILWQLMSCTEPYDTVDFSSYAKQLFPTPETEDSTTPHSLISTANSDQHTSNSTNIPIVQQDSKSVLNIASTQTTTNTSTNTVHNATSDLASLSIAQNSSTYTAPPTNSTSTSSQLSSSSSNNNNGTQTNTATAHATGGFSTNKDLLAQFPQLAELFSFVDCVGYGKLRPEMPKEQMKSLVDLIQDCWDANPNRRPPFPSIVKRLDQVLVDCAIRDPMANRFWKDHFLAQGGEAVRWKDFCNNFAQFVGLTTPGSLPILDLIAIHHPKLKDTNVPLEIKCLYELLVKMSLGSSSASGSGSSAHPAAPSSATSPTTPLHGGEEYVTMHAFGKLMDWFGPIKPDAKSAILPRILRLLQQPWFHGDIATANAEAVLSTKEAGTFLVRFSNSAPGAFVISKTVAGRSVHHYRVTRVAANKVQAKTTASTGAQTSPASLVNSTSDSTTTCTYNNQPCSSNNNSSNNTSNSTVSSVKSDSDNSKAYFDSPPLPTTTSVPTSTSSTAPSVSTTPSTTTISSPAKNNRASLVSATRGGGGLSILQTTGSTGYTSPYNSMEIPNLHFAFGNQVFETLQDLISSPVAEAHGFLYACADSPFTKLFDANSMPVGGYVYETKSNQ